MSYVLVTVNEPLSRELGIAIAVEASSLAHSQNLRAFLYDLRHSKNIERIVSNYDFVHRDMRPLQLDPNAHVALLVAVDDHSHDFVETVSRNAGYDVRIFTDEASAIRWLQAS